MTKLQNSFSLHFQKEKCRIFLNEPLKNHCSFKIGGEAEILVIPETEKVLSEIIKYAYNNNIPHHILGNGSNVLISDDGLRGIVIKLMGGLTDLIYLGDGIIACSAGVSLNKLCNFALSHSLTGLEFAYGIPGSVGGAVYMNAGAYNGEIKNVLMSVRSIDNEKGIPQEINASEIKLDYRNTEFMENKRIITAAYFKLSEGNAESIKEQMDFLMAKRKNSQPLEYPSAGSTFKRPKEGYAAAHIDECGLKGFGIGDAMVSEKHAGFVINKGNATFSDVITLMKAIQKTVYEKHGVQLEPEVEILKD